MKASILFLLFLAIGCSHRSHLEQLRSEVSQHEARNLKEIRDELELILTNHPELSEEVKTKITQNVEDSLRRHQELRNKESEIFQHVLKEAVANDPTGTQEGKAQRKELRMIYEQKSDNLFELVKGIRSLTGPDERIQQEMEILLREFR